MYWKNSDYQIIHQLVGSCHTITEARRVANVLLEERTYSVKTVNSENYRSQAKFVFAKKTLASDDDQVDKLNATASKEEQQTRTALTKDTLEYARHEIDVLKQIITKLTVKCKYKHLDDLDAYQAIQLEEDFYQCYWSAYLNLASTGYIPTDLLHSIKLHPHSAILIELIRILKQESTSSGFAKLTKLILFARVDVYLDTPNVNTLMCANKQENTNDLFRLSNRDNQSLEQDTGSS